MDFVHVHYSIMSLIEIKYTDNRQAPTNSTNNLNANTAFIFMRNRTTTMPSADRDDKEDAYFETVVKGRKSRTPKVDLSFSKEPRNGARQQRLTVSGAKTKNCRNSMTTTLTFGRSSWTRPKTGSAKESEASANHGRSDCDTSQSSRVGLPLPAVVGSPPADGGESTIATVGQIEGILPPSSVRDDTTPEADVRTEDDAEFSMKQPMSSLLAEYGEQDVEWEKVTVSQTQEVPCDGDGIRVPDNGPETAAAQRNESRLGQHGKAPIHVEFVSFGYYHGAPQAARNGWSYGNPLPVLDCRDEIAAVPPHLSWQDGLSGSVKYTLLRADGARVRSLAKDLAERAAEAIVGAADEGGHGYVSPLHAQVFVASDSGRHRSVVVVEMAATAMRNLLRRNDGNRFSCPSSVSTKHLHLERRQRVGQQSSKGNSKSKQKELDDD